MHNTREWYREHRDDQADEYGKPPLQFALEQVMGAIVNYSFMAIREEMRDWLNEPRRNPQPAQAQAETRNQ
jgi:hypothetical protein